MPGLYRLKVNQPLLVCANDSLRHLIFIIKVSCSKVVVPEALKKCPKHPTRIDT